jgi:hypothetical protein
VPRSLNEIIADQERAFQELLAAQRELNALHRAGRELTPLDGQTSEIDRSLERVYQAQHALDTLNAEAVEAATIPRQS